MAKGLSMHIGINRLDTGVFKSGGYLVSPENDARALAELAEKLGYETPILLLNEEATKENFLAKIDSIVTQMEAGDIFLLTFSGHGGSVKDENGDEEEQGVISRDKTKDKQDETWCFHNGTIIDDVIGRKWPLFKPGVRIVVVSASCHSRSALKVPTWGKEGIAFPLSDEACIQNIDETITRSFYRYKHDPDIKASILHLSACKDHQQAYDGEHFSRFIRLMLEFYSGGDFDGSYISLIEKIRTQSGYNQQAGIGVLGVYNEAFINSKPFSIT